MRKLAVILLALTVTFLFASSVQARQQDRGRTQGQSKDDMGGTDMSHMAGMHHDATEQPEAARSANDAMSHDHMEMNPHMYMTELRSANEADERRAEQILDTLRASIEKYKDYKAAVADGYQIFLPNVPQPRYHFTNWRYAFEAEFTFNSAHPTSLLYERTTDGYRLVGAMYTAPKKDSEDQLNERVPLSVARWHRHINFCMPQKGQRVRPVDWKKFGMGGSISSEEACEAASGHWVPQIFGWMVHVNPFEIDTAKIWAH